MATPYDSAIDMFQLPRFGVGASPFPVREDPVAAARRRFLEGDAGAKQDPDSFIKERAAATNDPFGVMAEVENLRREREEQGFISDIAKLSPGSTDYNQSIMGLIQKNPRIAQSRGALELIDIQRKLAPEVKDYTGQFRDPVYREAYKKRVGSGLSPDAAYQETLMEADNEDMAIKLISAGIPLERHGDLMTGGAFDRRKVAQAIYGTKPARQGYDLPLSGDAKTEFESIVQEMAAARTGRAEPTDEEKMQFLTPGKKEYSEQEWAEAYRKALPAAQQRAMQDAQNRMNLFQQTYGDYYKLPQGIAGIQTPSIAPQTVPAAVTQEGSTARWPSGVPTAGPGIRPETTPMTAKAGFPTLGDDLPPTVPEAVMAMTSQAAQNIRGNVMQSPLANPSTLLNPGGFERAGQTIRNLVTPSGLQDMATTSPPTDEQISQRWTDAKKMVDDYINKIAPNEEQKVKMLGSLATEQEVPYGSYMDPTIAQRFNAIGRRSAPSAFEIGFNLANPEQSKFMLRDKEADRSIKDVARIYAIEELTKRGLIAAPNTPTPAKAAPSGAKYTITRK